MIERSKVKYLRPSRTKAQAQPGDYAHMFRFLEKKIFNTGVKSLPKVEKLASTAGALPKDKAISAWQTYEYCTDWYTAGVNNGEIDWSTLHSSGYSTCYTETVWVDDDNPYTPPYEASDPPPFSGGGGGGTGENNSGYREIFDRVEDPCIKAQVTNALNAKTTIGNMLNSEFGTKNFNDRDIFFYDITTLPDSIAGTTHGENAYTFVINLNKNTLPNRSKEYILSTIYHEILHAYMDTQIAKDPSGKYIISNQHQTMARDYVFLMTGALKIAFPGIDDKDAWTLSWGGLEDTPFYTTKLTASQRSEIQSINDKHKKSNPKESRNGTYCN